MQMSYLMAYLGFMESARQGALEYTDCCDSVLKQLLMIHLWITALLWNCALKIALSSVHMYSLRILLLPVSVRFIIKVVMHCNQNNSDGPAETGSTQLGQYCYGRLKEVV